jgi:hypothetical protein
MQGEYFAGRAPPDRHTQPYMTHLISGTGCPRKPNPRLPSPYLTFRAVLGSSSA